MLKAIRKGTTKMEPVAPRRLKHSFDSLSYIIISEEPSAMEQSIPTVNRTAPSVVSL
jgi:hypothetical protein